MDIMLDNETLGNGSNSAIVAIGAVKFDTTTGELGEEFYQLIHPESCAKAGLVIDASTVLWWLKQSEEARAAFADESEMAPLAQALERFTDFCGGPSNGLRIWGNGADFDNVILANAYKAVGMTPPWQFFNNRCYRTVAALRGSIKRNRFGTHHNALDDAKTQAQHLIEIMASL